MDSILLKQQRACAVKHPHLNSLHFRALKSIKNVCKIFAPVLMAGGIGLIVGSTLVLTCCEVTDPDFYSDEKLDIREYLKFKGFMLLIAFQFYIFIKNRK